MFDPMEFEIDEPEKVVYVVGIGPGDVYYLTQEAQNVLEHADAICGYKLYLDLIEPEFPCEEYYSTGMTQEIDRCRWALEKANTGRRVVMVCSGDAGVYGMASPVLELAQDYPDVAVEVVPGLTAALSGGAVLGAPLAHDFCVISLSDRLTPWEVIENWPRGPERPGADAGRAGKHAGGYVHHRVYRQQQYPRPFGPDGHAAGVP